MAGNALICISILLRRSRNHFGRQSRRGGALVPADFFQIIANVLLVEGRLRFSRRVFLGGPEPRRVRCKRLVDHIISLPIMPNSNFVSAMMIPRSAAYSEARR